HAHRARLDPPHRDRAPRRQARQRDPRPRRPRAHRLRHRPGPRRHDHLHPGDRHARVHVPRAARREPVTPASDIFSWGVTMVFAATGRLPFTGDTIPAILNAILNKDPDLTGVPEPLCSLVASCLAKHPGDRPTAEYLLLRLTSAPGPWAGAAGSARPASSAPSAPAPAAAAATRSIGDEPARPSRRSLLVGGAAAAGLVAAGGAALAPFLLPEDADTGGVQRPRAASVGPR